MSPTRHGEPEVALLLEFLQGRDVACPLCGYNLRDLRVPRCPECRHDLSLAVGIQGLRFGWFLAAVAPGIFSGIAAALLMVPMVLAVVETLRGGGPFPWPVMAVDAFGWLSGILAVLLVWRRHAFLRQRMDRQRGWAVVAWAVHVAAFLVLLALALWFGL